MHTVNEQLSVMKRTFLHVISNIKTKQLFLVVTLQMLKKWANFSPSIGSSTFCPRFVREISRPRSTWCPSIEI